MKVVRGCVSTIPFYPSLLFFCFLIHTAMAPHEAHSERPQEIVTCLSRSHIGFLPIFSNHAAIAEKTCVVYAFREITVL